jgi:hypothetical protein
MKNTITVKSLVLTLMIGALTTTSTFAQKKGKADKNKFLEGRKFDVQFYEMKAGGRGKAVKSTVIIKGGKIEGDLMYEKLSLNPITYKVTLDSTYTEDESEMRMVTLEATDSADKSDYKWEATVTNYDIEGTVTQSKAGVEKKKYEFAGSEKAKK